MNPDQSAPNGAVWSPNGAVWSESILFVIYSGNHKIIVHRLINVFFIHCTYIWKKSSYTNFSFKILLSLCSWADCVSLISVAEQIGSSLSDSQAQKIWFLVICLINVSPFMHGSRKFCQMKSNLTLTCFFFGCFCCCCIVRYY